MNIFIRNGNRKRFFFQSLPMAGFTRRDPHKCLIFLLRHIRPCLTITTLHVADQPLKCYVVNTDTTLTTIMYHHFSAICSMKDHIPHCFRQFLIWCIQIEIILLCQSLQNRISIAGWITGRLPAHNLDCSLRQRQTLIRDHQILIKFHFVTKAETLRAGTKRIIKRKASWLNLINADTTVRAGKTLGKLYQFPANDIHRHQTVCQFQNIFNGIHQTFFNAFLYHQTINHHFNVVFFIFIQADLLGQFIHTSINLYTDITAALDAVQQLLMGPLSAPYHRCQQLDLRPFRKLHDLICHLIYCLFFDLFPTFRAMRDTDPGIQQTEIIINFCHGPHGRTWVAVCGFLVNRNRRGQSLNLLHIRFFHLSKKLPGIG